MKTEKDPKPNDGHVTDDARAPYEPPTLDCDELFETLALACGKVQPMTHNCQTKNRQS
jgi:hypothetical protein